MELIERHLLMCCIHTKFTLCVDLSEPLHCCLKDMSIRRIVEKRAIRREVQYRVCDYGRLANHNAPIMAQNLGAV